MNDVQIIDNNEVATTTDFKQIAIDYLHNMGMRLPPKWANQFIELSKLYGLNPFKREIYAVGYGDNYNIITGYEVYLKRAERIGKLNGWNCVVSGEGDNMQATITIYRKDWEYPFTHTVYYDECVQTTIDKQTRQTRPNKMWAKMPRFMLKKVAVAQGFRMCFSDEMGGMPYTSDELPEIERNVDNLKNVEKVTNPDEQLSPQASKLYKQEHAETTQQQAEQIDYAIKLEEIITEHKDLLNVNNSSGNPYTMANDCLLRGDLESIKIMYERVLKYLASKNVRVA